MLFWYGDQGQNFEKDVAFLLIWPDLLYREHDFTSPKVIIPYSKILFKRLNVSYKFVGMQLC